MTREELKNLVNQPGETFPITERISLADIGDLFAAAEHWLQDEGLDLTPFFPEDFFDWSSLSSLGIDYLDLQLPQDGRPLQASMTISWANPEFAIIPDLIVLEGFQVTLNLYGSMVTATMEGLFEIEEMELDIAVELPSFYTEARLITDDAVAERPSAQSLLNRFQASPRPNAEAAGPQIDTFFILANPRMRRAFFQLALSEIEIGPIELAFDTQLVYEAGDVSGRFFSEFIIDVDPANNRQIMILLEGAHDGPGTGWQLEGGMALDNFMLVETFTALLGHFDLDGPSAPQLPPAIHGADVALKYIYLSLDTATKEFNFKCSLDFHDLFFSGNNRPNDAIDLNIGLHFAPVTDAAGNESHQLTVSGQLIFQLNEGSDDPLEMEFDLVFDDNASEKSLVAAYKNQAGGTVTLKQIIQLFTNADLGNFNFPIDLKQAYFLSSEKGGSRHFLIGLDIGGGIDLSQLPLVGQLLPNAQQLSINLQPSYASADFDADELLNLGDLVPGDGLNLPSTASQGPDISITLNLGDKPFHLEMPIQLGDVNGQGGSANGQPAPTPVNNQDATTDDGTHWLKIQKSFGPITFERLGVKYEDQRFWFKLDGAMTAAGLTLSLDGLGVGVTLPEIDPTFELRGLGLDFQKGDFEIGGSFLRIKGDPYDEYLGMATMKYKQLGLSAIGAYSWVNGNPSLFLYAVLNYPIGGPAFFFVTGLAAGFGYNRSLKMPDIDQVETFPMVALAMGAGSAPTPSTDADRRMMLTNVLNSLHDSIQPADGQYFIAAGIKFTSFKLIDSFVLLAVSFGVHFEIDVLGLSTLSVPSADLGGSAVKPLAVAKLALKGSFIPDQGFMGIEARLTKDSYIFTEDCHLTGGFAFYTWFDPNEHAGDFVLTLGGYHPKFRKPDHYPDVPRLGVNWQVTSNLSLKADFYFALTASALMAGGHLNATYHSGDIKAWFKAGADFIISWKPYYYDASLYVNMGVDVTIHFFGTHHLSFDLGADVHVWGPEFAGKATIHLSVISFTITFGSDNTTPAYISWENFLHSFIPEPEKVCTLQAVNGVIREISDDNGKHQLVNPKDLEIVFTSAVPISDASDLDADWKSGENVAGAEIAPVGMRPIQNGQPGQINSIFNLTLSGPENQDAFAFEPVFNRVPAALWGAPLSSTSPFVPKPGKPDINAPRFVEHALSGFKMRPLNPPESGITKMIDRADIAYSTHQLEDAFEFEGEALFTPASIIPDDDIKDERDYINAHLLDQTPSAIRSSIISHLGYDAEKLDLRIDNELAEVFVENPIVGDFN